MTQALKKAARVIFTEKCMQTYFDEFNFFEAECFKATLSKFLGLAIIAGSLLVKIPQIVKILKNKSAEGINLFSVFLDVFAITAMACYSFVSGFPFSSWGDGIFLGFQTLTIAFLVMHFNGNTAQATTFLAAYVGIVLAAISGLTPLSILWVCQTMNIPIVLISKLAQAFTNYNNGNTGQLSAITGFLLFLGSLARIFTSIQETGDATMILMHTSSATANAVLVFQIIYYWNVTSEEKSKKVQ